MKITDRSEEKVLSFLIKFAGESDSDIFEQYVEVPISVGQICMHDKLSASEELNGPAVVLATTLVPTQISNNREEAHWSLAANEKILFTRRKETFLLSQGKVDYYEARLANNSGKPFWIREDFFLSRIQNGPKWLLQLNVVCDSTIYTPTIIVANKNNKREYSKYKFKSSFSIPNEILNTIKTIKLTPIQ